MFQQHGSAVRPYDTVNPGYRTLRIRSFSCYTALIAIPTHQTTIAGSLYFRSSVRSDRSTERICIVRTELRPDGVLFAAADAVLLRDGEL